MLLSCSSRHIQRRRRSDGQPTGKFPTGIVATTALLAVSITETELEPNIHPEWSHKRRPRWEQLPQQGAESGRESRQPRGRARCQSPKRYSTCGSAHRRCIEPPPGYTPPPQQEQHHTAKQPTPTQLVVDIDPRVQEPSSVIAHRPLLQRHADERRTSPATLREQLSPFEYHPGNTLTIRQHPTGRGAIPSSGRGEYPSCWKFNSAARYAATSREILILHCFPEPAED